VQDQKHGELSTWIKWTILKDKNSIPDFVFTVKVNASFLGGREGSEGTREEEPQIQYQNKFIILQNGFWVKGEGRKIGFQSGRNLL